MDKSCFTDLNIALQGDKKANNELLRRAADYGYECVALNKEVTLVKKVQLKAAADLTSLVDTIPLTCKRKPLRVIRRLTVAADDPSLLHALASPALDSFDVLAVQPSTDKVFQQACGSLNIDLISVDLSERLSFNFKNTQIRQAIDRGVCFEICYTQAIRDATARRNILANALQLAKAAKGKNIVVSSQARNAFDMRAPIDVVNLSRLFGIADDRCKATVTSNCRSVLLHARMRAHTAKGVVSSTPLEEAMDLPPSSVPGALQSSEGGQKARNRKRKRQSCD